MYKASLGGALTGGARAKVAGWPALADPALQAFRTVLQAPGSVDGLKPIFLRRVQHAAEGAPHIVSTRASVSFGARGDSYYEYLLKQFLAGGRTEPLFLEQYEAAMMGMRRWLVGSTAPNDTNRGLTYVGEMYSSEIRDHDAGDAEAQAGNDAHQQQSAHLSPKVDHLVCFLPGVLALGHLHGIETGAQISCVNALQAIPDVRT